ncbi:hypothetical protein Dda_1576 [Drechslerella dactyloides]|uniref:Uncharacterized protein n=1 Tax=Drechslerella dactyloides TaxID=74499 RepID=A0AAD6NN77_DREDA|nr:hypothetical protein Dda_1576 [Drechslerella dactyloides]
MRWLTSLTVLAGVVVGLAQAAVPEALSEAFVDGQTMSVKFGDTTVENGDTVSVGSLSSSPVFTIKSPRNPIAGNTLYTIVLLDITNSRDPTTHANLHYAASNLRVTASGGSELTSGTIDFPYVPPSPGTNNGNYIFLAYSQQNGDISGLQSLPNGSDTFSINIFRQKNQLQLADTRLGYTVSNAAISPRAFTFPNSTTTAQSSSTSETSSSSPSPSPTQPPPEPITSYFTLPGGGVTKTVFTQPNAPASSSTVAPPASSTTPAPSVITGSNNAVSQSAPSRSIAALLGLGIAFFVFV